MKEQHNHCPQTVCPQCGEERMNAAQFCRKCGYSDKPELFWEDSTEIKREQRIDPMIFHPDTPLGADRLGEVSTVDIVCAVGKREHYYLPAFETIGRLKGRGRFHVFALLFGGAWMLYRKQYLRGTVLLLVQLLLQAAAAVTNVLYALPIVESIFADPQVTAIPDTMTEEKLAAVLRVFSDLPLAQRALCLLPILLLIAGVVLAIVVAFYANRWYFSHLVALIKKEDAQHQTAKQKKEALLRNGGVNLPLIICLLICYLVFSRYFSFFLAVLAV